MSAKPQTGQRGCGREAVELLYNRVSTANPRKPPAFPKRRPRRGRTAAGDAWSRAGTRMFDPLGAELRGCALPRVRLRLTRGYRIVRPHGAGCRADTRRDPLMARPAAAQHPRGIQDAWRSCFFNTENALFPRACSAHGNERKSE